jgi:plastocyanin
MLAQARRNPSRSFAWLIPAAMLLATTLWLVSAPRARAAETMVDISGFAFQPGTVTIKVGDTVTWTNSDTTAHTATSTDDPALFDGEMAPGESFSFTFTEAGSFDYFCEIHPTMEGTVVVQAAAAPSASQLPDGAMPIVGGGEMPPGVALGLALMLLSLLAWAVVASRRGQATR